LRHDGDAQHGRAACLPHYFAEHPGETIVSPALCRIFGNIAIKREKIMAARKQRPERRPSALKHGVFSASGILPGEDPAEFDALFRSLKNEWQPSGITERAAVLGLAQCLWRLHRLDVFEQAELLKARVCLPWDMLKVLEMMAKYSGDKKELRVQFRSAASTDPGLYQALQELRPLLEGTDIWKALVEDDGNALDIAGSSKAEFDALGLSEKRDSWLTSMVLQAAKERDYADLVTPERFEKELALRERLEGMADRYIKRIMQLKAGKRTLGLERLEPPESPPNRFPPPKLVK
jgi:hypothetical protein